ncbi:DNA repair endonuclease XPF [Diaphorina citri]|uniref:DNA repair endonuclease XPF n=1 Tax=Diaphorina citri TaxID=121845 RepID=A0A3Q0J8J6_DIACI|nr:DNA repair endonuclease XPF [Diaphorina citri]
MSACQNAVLDIGSYLLKELKRLNVGLLDMDEISIESIYSSQFHRSLQVKLDPVWHQLSKVSKQIIADLRTLRHLLLLLLDSDAIHLASVLASLRSPDYVHKSSGWPLLDQAETLILNVEERRSKREQQPKWSVLKEILSEIHDSSGKEGGGGQEMALVLVNDVSTCRQLRKLLTDGADKIFNDTTRYISRTRPESLAQLGKPPSTESPTDDPDTPDDPVDKDSQDSDEEEEESFMLSQKPNERELCLTADRVAEPTVVLHDVKNHSAQDLSSKLRSLKPTSVIFYNADVAAIRQVEVYQCAQSEVKVKVFFMQYGESVEEQAYLSDLRREKKAFEYLIQEKTNMAVPTEQDGVSTEPEESCGRVIVDMREFRSELPVLLHKRGLYIEPVTISVGDYILSPDICVERKSISDLIGSLQSGRLYTQVQQMCRHYAKPLLLIEFDHNKPFELQGNYYLSRDIAAKSSDITAKLQLLTLHFPKLRLIWSSGPYNTAQLFFELKQGRDEPSAEVASSIGQTPNEDYTDRYNAAIEDFISKLPGVTSKNKAAVLNRGSSLPALCKLSEQELCSLVENTTLGNALYKALHTRPEVSSGSLVTRTKKHQRFRATKAAPRFHHTKWHFMAWIQTTNPCILRPLH